ncbi:hypothetical protein BGP76_00590 [Reichenbachiella sp. MSK19-1]|nr:hypothetical protein BGP76_00590 [Reichenbachiella sp. MSK19-1]
MGKQTVALAQAQAPPCARGRPTLRKARSLLGVFPVLGFPLFNLYAFIAQCLQARQAMLTAGKRFFFMAKKGSKKARNQ